MPIIYNPEDGGWQAKDLSKEEEQSLINIATRIIIEALGEELCEKIMMAAGAKMALEDTPKEDMYSA